VIVRHGGDEFPLRAARDHRDRGTYSAGRFAAELRAAESPESVTFGVAELREGENPDSLIDRADRDLLAARGGSPDSKTSLHCLRHGPHLVTGFTGRSRVIRLVDAEEPVRRR
jgi:GGDEF domain-containing protein